STSSACSSSSPACSRSPVWVLGAPAPPPPTTCRIRVARRRRDGAGEREAGLDMSVDKGRIEKAVREILEAIGEDPDRDGLQRTPLRIADAYAEIFSGLHTDPSRFLKI